MRAPWTDLLLGPLVLGTAVLFVAYGEGGVLRLAAALVGVLAAPGYAAVSALFPRREDVEPLGRAALSLGLSVAAVPLMALLLDHTAWGIRPLPMAVALLLVTVLLSVIALMRRVAAGRRATAPAAALAQPVSRGLLLAGLAALAGVLTVGGLTLGQRAGTVATEFYVLGDGGGLSRYPYRVQAGEPFPVRLGVRSQETAATTYRIQSPDCAPLPALPPLAPGGAWEGTLSCTAAAATRTLTFSLLRGEEVYRTLALRVRP